MGYPPSWLTVIGDCSGLLEAFFCQMPFLSSFPFPHPYHSWGRNLSLYGLLAKKSKVPLFMITNVNIAKHSEMWAHIPRLMIQHFTPYETNITQHYPWDKEKRQFGAIVAVWALEFPEDWGDCRLALLCFRAQVLGGKCWWLRGMRGEAVFRGLSWLPLPASVINKLRSQTNL